MKPFEKIKEIFKEKPILKKLLIPSVLVVCVAGFFYYKSATKPEIPVFVPEIRTFTLEKQSLADSISVTGTVKSTNVVNVTTTLPYKVKEILVTVGDKVKKGDILFKLDTTEILKDIEDETKKLNDSKSALKETLDKAITKRDQSYSDYSYSVNIHKTSITTLDTAKQALTKADASIKIFLDEYNSAVSQRESKGVTYNQSYENLKNSQNSVNSAQTNLNEAEAQLLQKTDEYNTANTNYTNSPTAENKVILDNALAAKNQAESVKNTRIAEKTAADEHLKNATDAHTKAKDDFTAAENFAKTKETALNDAKSASNYEKYLQAFNAAQSTFNTTLSSQDLSYKTYNLDLESANSAQKAYDNAGTSSILTDLNKKLSECTIKSETGGVITSIYAVVGSANGSANTTGGPLAVIQDTDNLVLSTSFKEYDIPNIKIGQNVTIKSDATGDKIITGVVSQISLTAGTAQGSSDAVFPAEIKIDTADSGLLIGMNAKGNVIVTQKDNIFVVPDDSIGTNAAGENVIFVQSEPNVFKEVVVTTGMSNDYYTEVTSPELKEGMIVRSSANENGSGMMQNGGEGAASGGAMGGGSTSVMVVG